MPLKLKEVKKSPPHIPGLLKHALEEAYRIDDDSPPALQALLQIPPDFEAVGDITPEEANSLAFEYSEACFDEGIQTYQQTAEFYRQNWTEPKLIPGLHSTYLYEVMEYLLECGLDPNYCKDEDYSLMENIRYTLNGYVAADTLHLLLEHGGDPNLAHGGESLFDVIDYDVDYDMDGQIDRRLFDSLVHCWMVIIGFGGGQVRGATPLTRYREWNLFNHHEKTFDVRDLRNHRNYTFGLSHVEDRDYAPVLHIFDRRTGWEVARR